MWVVRAEMVGIAVAWRLAGWLCCWWRVGLLEVGFWLAEGGDSVW